MIRVHGTDGFAQFPLGAGSAQGAPAVTIGNFDGVHRGHRALIDATRARAAAMGAPSAVLTFDPAPRDVLRPGNGIPRIQPLERKLVHLARAGVDFTVVQDFDRALAALSPEDFAREHLGRRLRARAVVVGHDFRFGRGRAGNADTLREVLGVPVDEVDALVDDQGPISSSRVRAAIGSGDVSTAAALLGRPHELVGAVVTGDQRGRTIGFPTANVDLSGGGLCPHLGVYAVRAEVRGQSWDGVANIGVRPTFGGDAPRLEVHLLGFPPAGVGGDLYGEVLVVSFAARIRDERRFPGVDALVAQIHADVDAARRILAG